MYQGVQTMNTSALKFMALYPDNIPTRDSLNITTNFIGEGNKIQIDKENILRQQRFANMYQTIKKGIRLTKWYEIWNCVHEIFSKKKVKK